MTHVQKGDNITIRGFEALDVEVLDLEIMETDSRAQQEWSAFDLKRLVGVHPVPIGVGSQNW